MARRFYFGARSFSRPLVKLLWNPRVTGLENVPREGGFVIASNHLANIDSFVLPVVLPRQIRFVAKDTLWTQKGPRGRLLRWFFDAVEAVPVDREALSSGKGALQAGLSILRDGDGFAIYPEGTRSRSGLLYRGHTGVAYLALAARVPIVPVGLLGTERVQPIGVNRPRVRPFTVRFGRPLRLHERYGDLPAGRARRLITDDLMAAIADLTGQQPAPEYNDRPVA